MHIQTFKDIVTACKALPAELQKELLYNAAEYDDATREQIATSIEQEMLDEIEIIQGAQVEMQDIEKTTKKEFREMQEEVDRKEDLKNLPDFSS